MLAGPFFQQFWQPCQHSLLQTITSTTRDKKVDKWKTGFYYIAKGAGVPIVMFTLDFGKKQVAVSPPYYPTDYMEKDFKVFHDFYKDVKGANPSQF